MEFHEQCQPKPKDSVTTQHAGSPTKQEEEEEALPSATYLRVVANGPNNVNRSIIVKNVNYDDDYFPPGFRFSPFDDELIVHYLKKKVMNQKLPHNKIPEVNLYRYHPQHLAERFPTLGEKDWYFFTPRDRKYRNGIRPNRAAGDGYWKATGADKVVKHKGVAVGSRKALVFYTGKPPKGDKTNWIMHEFRVNQPPRNKSSADDMRLDDWVLCRIYKKADQNKAQHSIKESEHGHSTSTMVSQASSQPVNDNILSRLHDLFCEESYCDQRRSSIQNGLPELPQCIDASLQNLSNFNGHPQQGLNHAAQPLGFRRPPAHSTEDILRSTYLREVNSDPKPRGVQEEIWNTQNFENSDLASQYGFSNSSYMEFPNLDNILPNIAPNHPPNNPYNNNAHAPYHPPINPHNNNVHAPYHPPINPHNNNAHAPYHPPINPHNNNAHAPNHPPINPHNNNAHAPNHPPINPHNNNAHAPNRPPINPHNNNAPNHLPNNPYNADNVLPNHPPNNLYNADDVLPSHPPNHPPNNLYNIDDVLPNHPPNNHPPNNP